MQMLTFVHMPEHFVQGPFHKSFGAMARVCVCESVTYAALSQTRAVICNIHSHERLNAFND